MSFFRLNIVQGFSKSVYKNINLTRSNTFKADQLKLTPTSQPKQLPVFDAKTLAFGKNETDHMFSVDYNSKTGWGIPEIKPFEPLKIHPFNSSLHYAVQCFEGMKAYKNPKGQIRLFRPECNALRLLRSSSRVALPQFDGNQMLKCLKEYVKVESRWIPNASEFSLYLRPLHISMENSLGVKSPGASKLLIMGCPVGPYYPEGFMPISLSCSVDSIRSAPGGTGCYKIGGNYGPTLKKGNQVISKGYQQVLWLYGDEVVEAGTSNVFFVFKGKHGKIDIVTPDLQDLILPGVTRDSIIAMLESKSEYTIAERKITITEVLERNEKGELLECFSAGTAVIVGSVKNIEYKGKNNPIKINEKLQMGEVAYKIREELLSIQEGRKADPYGWSLIVK